MNTKVIKLNGGGTLLLTRVKGVNGVDVEFRFNGGAINDPKNKLGVAHFAEHALFEFSTTRYSAEERLRLRKKFNMLNGETSYYMMRLICQVNKNMLDEAFDYVLSPISEIIYNQKDFDLQINIIKSEFATLRKTNMWVANQVFQSNIIADKRTKHLTDTPGGNVETLEKIKLIDIENYIKNYVTLNNLTIALCGDISVKHAKRLIEKYVYKYIPISNVQSIDFNDFEGITKPNYYYRPSIEKSQAHVEFLFDIQPYPQFDFRKNALNTLLTEILYSMTYNHFRGDNGLCYRCGNSFNTDAKILKNAIAFNVEEENVQRLLDEMPKFIAKNPELDKDLFETIKKTIISTFDFDYDPIQKINRSATNRYLNDKLVYGDKLKKMLLKHLHCITYEMANEFYKECFKGNPYLIIVSNDDKWKDFDYKSYCKKFKK